MEVADKCPGFGMRSAAYRSGSHRKRVSSLQNDSSETFRFLNEKRM